MHTILMMQFHPTVIAGLAPTPRSRFDELVDGLARLWHIELFNAGDSPVQLNQLVIAIFVAIIGIWLSKRITRIAQARMLRITAIDRNAAAAIQKILFYVMVAIVVLIALPIAGIPITIFTILGGALAIGVGFGAQNLFSNLIAGLMIMIEKPIRLGDIVEVSDMIGKVEDIGSRSTRIRRFDGIDVLIPNSHFLQNPVVNWTLSDTFVRTTVKVGVAYGSPTKLVAGLIRQALDEQEDVIRDADHPIMVLFENFGDNALEFEAVFWTSIGRPVSLRELRSNIRFRIDELFRQADVVIAFPQRDVHLDTLRPLQVEIVGESPGMPA
jgi:small-conductance mechanosensitive channel